MFDLSGKVAVVTGGNAGIGLGMARGLASAGAAIVVAARTQEKSRAAVADLEGRGAKAISVAVDVTGETAVAKLMQTTVERLGRLDILVNNAGINIGAPPHELSTSDWHKVIDTNLTSAFLCSKAAYPIMKQAGGKIISVGSMMTIFAASRVPAYAASKGGIVQFTRSLACAWARDNIQANAVLPGWIDTHLTRAARQRIPDLEESVVRRTPAGRWGTSDDLAGIAIFLASPASNFITGAAITVDGGYSIQG